MPDVWTEPLEDANSCEEFTVAFLFFGAISAIASVISIAAIGSSEWIGLSGAYVATISAILLPIAARPKSVMELWEFEEEEESARESGSNASMACAFVKRAAWSWCSGREVAPLTFAVSTILWVISSAFAFVVCARMDDMIDKVFRCCDSVGSPIDGSQTARILALAASYYAMVSLICAAISGLFVAHATARVSMKMTLVDQ